MQFKLLAVSLVASLVAADTVSQAVKGIPNCALLCYNKAATDRGCKATDFQCVCSASNSAAIVAASTTSCNSCSFTDSFSTGTALANLCVSFANRPTEADVVSAANALQASITTANATAHNSAPGNHPPAVKGVLGVAAIGLAATLML